MVEITWDKLHLQSQENIYVTTWRARAYCIGCTTRYTGCCRKLAGIVTIMLLVTSGRDGSVRTYAGDGMVWYTRV